MWPNPQFPASLSFLYSGLPIYISHNSSKWPVADNKCVHKLPCSQFASLDELCIVQKPCKYYANYSKKRTGKHNDISFTRFRLENY